MHDSDITAMEQFQPLRVIGAMEVAMSLHAQPNQPLPLAMLARIVIAICEQQNVSLSSQKGGYIEAAVLLLYEHGLTSEVELIECTCRLCACRRPS